jgi:hypothetical protein
MDLSINQLLCTLCFALFCYKLTDVTVHAMKARIGVEGIIHPLLTLALDEGEQLNS